MSITVKEIQLADTRTINILQRIQNRLDCTLFDNETKQILHYGLSEELERIIFDEIERELKSYDEKNN